MSTTTHCIRIAQMLQMAMNYSNEEVASDEWVNELAHKELEKQEITVKEDETSENKTLTVNIECKPEDVTSVKAVHLVVRLQSNHKAIKQRLDYKKRE